MSGGITFGGGMPSMLDGLSPELLARLLQGSQPAVEPAADTGAQPGPAQAPQGGSGGVLAPLFDRRPMGAPQSFTGAGRDAQDDDEPLSAPRATGSLGRLMPPVAATEADTQRLERQMGSPADRAALAPVVAPLAGSSPAGAPPQPRGPQAVDAFDPLSGQPVSGSPTPLPAAQREPTGGVLGDLFGRLSDPRVYNTLLGIGAGILQGRTFGEGLGLGVQNAQRFNAAQSGQDLAQSKAAFEQYKLQREIAGQNQTAKIISERLRVPYEQGLAMAANPSFVQNFLSSQFGAQDGRVRTPEGMQVIPGSQQDPASIKAAADAGRESIPEAAARAGAITKATNDATPDEPDILGPGQVMLDPETHQPVASVPTKEAPTIKSIVRPDGSKVDREWNPATRTWVEPNMGANPPAPMADQGPVPAGVDPETYRKELAKATVAEQKGATQRAQAASTALPILERAERAYQALHDAGAIGPFHASGANRTWGGVWGKETEIHRQEYEAAQKDLELTKAQIAMKGQGTITDSERRLLGFTFPRLDAASGETGLTTLRGMREQFGKALNAPGLSTRPNPSSPEGGQAGGGGPRDSAGRPAGGPAFRFQQLRRGGMSEAEAYTRMQQEGF